MSSVLYLLDTNVEKLENNYELIKEGEVLISNYIITEYSKSHPKVIVDAVHYYLSSESMLAHIGKHIGLKDLILTNVSIIVYFSVIGHQT